MEKIKEFIENFTKQEAETIYLRRQPNIEEYNTALQKMNDYCIESLHNKFGMVPQRKLDDDEYYEEWGVKKYPNQRYTYKISQYKNDTYGDVYVVYVSTRNPINEIFSYGGCLFLTKINDELKIVRKYSFGDRRLIKDKFEDGTGLEDISFKKLKQPMSIERYMEPIDDKDAMEHYTMSI